MNKINILKILTIYTIIFLSLFMIIYYKEYKNVTIIISIIFIIVGIIFYILIRNMEIKKIYDIDKLYKKRNSLLNIPQSILFTGFFIFYSLSLVSLKLSQSYTRNYYYFIFFIIASIFIFINIIVEIKKYNSVLILIELIILSLTNLYVVTNEGAIYNGIADVIIHENFQNIIINTGHVQNTFNQYTYFPNWEILTSSLGIVSGVNQIYCIIFSINILVIIAIISMFLIGKNIGGSSNGLFASFMMALSVPFVRWSTLLTPSFIGLALCSLIFMLLFRRINTIISYILLFIIIIDLLLTHLFSSFMFLILLVLCLIGEIIYNIILLKNGNDPNSKIIIISNILLFTVLCFSAYWLYVGTNILIHILDSIELGIINVGTFSANISNSISYISLHDKIIDYLQLYIILFIFTFSILIFVGHIYKQRMAIGLPIILCSAVYFLSYLGPMTNMPILGGGGLQIVRFELYGLLFVCIIISFGLFYIQKHINIKYKYIILILIILIYILSSVNSSSYDIQILRDSMNKIPTPYYTTSEITTGTFTNAYLSDSMAITDAIFLPYMNITLGQDATSLYMEPNNILNNNYYYIIRNNELNERGLRFNAGKQIYEEIYIFKESTFVNQLYKLNKIYCSGTTSVILKE